MVRKIRFPRSRLLAVILAAVFATACLQVNTIAASATAAGRSGPADRFAPATTQPKVQWTFDWRSLVAPARSFSPLITSAKKNGSVRAIVGLQVLWTAEGRLTKTRQARQRAQLAAAARGVVATMRSQRYQVIHRYPTMPLLDLKLSPGALIALERGGRVAKIGEDYARPPDLAQSVPLVEADDTAALGFGGKGETIAILDTGVDASHPFFGGRVVGGCVVTIFPCAPEDPASIAASGPCTYTPNTQICQHGTHVAGIAAGANGTFNGTTFSGVAPQADIVSFKVVTPVFDPAGCTIGQQSDPICPEAYDGDTLLAMAQVEELNPVFHFAAVNYSFGSAAGGCPNYFAWLPSIVALLSEGIPFVVSSGNDANGAGFWKTQIQSPACISWAVSVGNTTKDDLVNPTSDSAPGLSLLAPGTGIVSSFAGSYAALTGTSMAAPHVAGAFAVLRQRFPTLDPLTLLNALQQTGKPITDPGNGLTKPRIRILTAMVKLGELPFHPGYKNKLPGGKIVSQGTGLGKGAGTITISNIPAGASVKRAYLYFMTVNGPDSDRAAFVNGTPVGGRLIGASRDPCTAGPNGAAARVYRANVTKLATHNGSYKISGVGGAGHGEGASLVIVLARPAAAQRGVVIQEGALTALPGETISHIFPLPVPAIVHGDLHVGAGAGDSHTEGPMKLGTATAFPANAFNDSDGPWWDDLSKTIKSPTPLGPINSLTTLTDCLTWAYAGLTYTP